LRPDAGRVLFDGDDVTGLGERELFAVRRRCQLIFQHATLFDALPVWENVAMPLRKRFRLSRREARERAIAALGKVHAAHLQAQLPAELGAGVKKRIAIARAIALEPEALLYDEPTTSLDPVAARRTDRLIREMADELSLTSLVVSHDLVSVRTTGDRVTFLQDGLVRFDGTPAEMFASRDEEVSGFVHGTSRRWNPPELP
jgi:phospholipid/cholesterol/gamma-HCH transport system ATP-binding protein